MPVISLNYPLIAIPILYRDRRILRGFSQRPSSLKLRESVEASTRSRNREIMRVNESNLVRHQVWNILANYGCLGWYRDCSQVGMDCWSRCRSPVFRPWVVFPRSSAPMLHWASLGHLGCEWWSTPESGCLLDWSRDQYARKASAALRSHRLLDSPRISLSSSEINGWQEEEDVTGKAANA